MLRVLDIETTGIDCSKDAVIEIASVDLTRDGITNEQQSFVNPDRSIPPASMAVHHIMDDDVRDAPSIADAITRFMGADHYVAHNAQFEQSFLEPMLGTNWVCTYKCALRVWPDLPSHSNQALRYQLGLAAPFGRDRHSIIAHRALGDCIVTAAIFMEISKKAKWPVILRWSQEPALKTVCDFGKHRGERFDAIPLDYLHWMRDKLTDDKDMQFTAAHWIADRANQLGKRTG